MYFKENEFVENEWAKILCNFFRSKDDSLVLLISSLVYSVTHCDVVEPALLYEINMYPFGSFKNKDTGLMFYCDNFKHEDNESFSLDSKRDRNEFEVQIINKFKNRKYDENIVTMLLKLLKIDPPFRPITFKILTALTFNFWYNKNLEELLSEKHNEMLNESFNLSIKILDKLYQKSSNYILFKEKFIEEWEKFEFIDHELLMKVIESPLSIIPVYVQESLEDLPSFLKSPQNEIEELQYAIQVFLTLRTMIMTLNKNQELNEVYSFSISEQMLKTGIFKADK